MLTIKNYITGVLVAGVLLHVPLLKKWRMLNLDKDKNSDKVTENNYTSSLKTINFYQAKTENKKTLFNSSLFGKEVLFHQITSNMEFRFQNYAFVGNIINVYKDEDEIIKFDVKLFMSTSDICFSEIPKITRKEITKDLILKGFVRSELMLA